MFVSPPHEKKEKKIITKKIIMIIMKIDAFWGIFFHKLFLQKNSKAIGMMRAVQ